MTVVTENVQNTILDFNENLKVIVDFINGLTDVKFVRVYKSKSRGRLGMYETLSINVVKANCRVQIDSDSRTPNSVYVWHERDDYLDDMSVLNYNGYKIACCAGNCVETNSKKFLGSFKLAEQTNESLAELFDTSELISMDNLLNQMMAFWNQHHEDDEQITIAY